MNVAIINYGMGNLGSVRRACEGLGAVTTLVEHPTLLSTSDRIILPGVGGFAEGMARLRSGGWIEAIRTLVLEEKKPILGICLGMQLLMSSGEEGGQTEGLNLMPGHVRRLDKLGCSLRIPHIGWNDIQLHTPTPLFKHIPNGTDFYFVHSYAAELDNPEQVSAIAHYDTNVVVATADHHIFGVQFHPEKSSKAGRRLLQNFLEYASC